MVTIKGWYAGGEVGGGIGDWGDECWANMRFKQGDGDRLLAILYSAFS